MGKVLISFLGTGSPSTTKGDRSMRNYRSANYRIGDMCYEHITFMSAALAKHYGVQKLLMVGTVHSMWEEAYRWFHDQNNATKVEDSEETYQIYDELGTYCEKANHDTDLFIPYQEEVEKAIGGGSKVLLIKYGITDEEIRENITRILSLQEYLNSGDELIVDITHSFRSLPIFIMNLLIYLKNVSSKKITISHIHYGMIEASSELGYSPVVDLKAMMEVQEWITGAYALGEFGNAYKIAELLNSEQDDKSASPILYDFSQAMNLNYLYSMQNFIQRLTGIKNKDYKSDLAQLIISPVIRDFVDTFRVKASQRYPQAHFQLKLADWQFRHKKFAQAYLTSHDAMISYVCEKNGIAWDDYENREVAKKVLGGKCARDESEQAIMELFTFYPTDDMKRWYKNHNRCRNGIAHTAKVEVNGKELFPNEIIKWLGMGIQALEELMV